MLVASLLVALRNFSMAMFAIIAIQITYMHRSLAKLLVTNQEHIGTVLHLCSRKEGFYDYWVKVRRID